MIERKTNIELCRIFLMFMIIILHFLNSDMGGALGNVQKNTYNYYLSHFLESACIIAVDVFIIITGYFMCDKKEIRLSKPLYVIYQMVLYGTLISIIHIIINKEFNIEIIKLAITSIFSRWFIINYAILYLLIPYINIVISHITSKNYKILLLILLTFFSVWPTFFTNITIKDYGYGIINFLILYLIGSYIKKYFDNFKCTYISVLLYIFFTVLTTIFSIYTARAFYYNSIFNIISAINFFMIFKSINIKNNKTINYISSFTLSTYIISENPFICKFLYRVIFKTPMYWNNNLFIINLLITTFGIFIICFIIEFMRRFFMKKSIDKLINKLKYCIKCE